MQFFVSFLVLAMMANAALGITVRRDRRQAGEDDDNIDDEQGQFPGQDQNNSRLQPPPSIVPATAGPTTTTQSPEVDACIRGCPVTSEYNPVCGSDRVTYSNPGRLNCAQRCGVNVGLARSSPCPTAPNAAPAPVIETQS